MMMIAHCLRIEHYEIAAYEITDAGRGELRRWLDDYAGGGPDYYQATGGPPAGNTSDSVSRLPPQRLPAVLACRCPVTGCCVLGGCCSGCLCTFLQASQLRQ